MAPIKFEERLKEKLEARRIEPSTDAWSKLSADLDKNKPNQKSKFWWLAIAASFLLILLTVLQVSKSPIEVLPSESYSIEEPVEKTDVPSSIAKPEELIKEEFNTISVAEVEDNLESDAPDRSSRVTNLNTATAKRDDSRQNEEVQPQLELVKTPVELTKDKDRAVAEVDKSLIQEVLNEARNSKEEQLDKETDSLLKAAQKELLINETMILDTRVVDANQLLMEVEEEVEPSLKSKVYEVFKGGFKKVKTAVAQRNN